MKYILNVDQPARIHLECYHYSEHDTLEQAQAKLAALQDDISHDPGRFHALIQAPDKEWVHEEEYKVEL